MKRVFFFFGQAETSSAQNAKQLEQDIQHVRSVLVEALSAPVLERDSFASIMLLEIVNGISFETIGAAHNRALEKLMQTSKNAGPKEEEEEEKVFV